MHSNQEIVKYRTSKNILNPFIPYHFLHEREVGVNGKIQEVNTIFLTGKECPFQCLMCDLWKNTLDQPTQRGAIIQQIDYALERLPAATVIKLYNSSNFFDKKAVPPQDFPEIAKRLKNYDRIIVENHPKLCGKSCLTFHDQLHGKLEIAMGLETIHPEVLPKLNKQMTQDDFQKATEFLTAHHIDVRTFILLNPPFLTDEQENMDWTLRSVQFAFESGAHCCTIIPTRLGNGIMEKLQKDGDYVPPKLQALEEVFDHALLQAGGRVFVDLWDLASFSGCTHCFESRKRRLDAMNFEQRVLLQIDCSCQYAS